MKRNETKSLDVLLRDLDEPIIDAGFSDRTMARLLNETALQPKRQKLMSWSEQIGWLLVASVAFGLVLARAPGGGLIELVSSIARPAEALATHAQNRISDFGLAVAVGLFLLWTFADEMPALLQSISSPRNKRRTS